MRISTHAGAYSAVPETELVAVADINREKLNKCGKNGMLNHEWAATHEIFEMTSVEKY